MEKQQELTHENPSPSATWAECYYYVAFVYRHPREEEIAYHNAYRPEEPLENIRTPKQMTHRNLSLRLGSMVREMMKAAAVEQELDWGTELSAEKVSKLHDYIERRWEEGKALASDLIEREPGLGQVQNPLQRDKDVAHEWQRMHEMRPGHYSLPLRGSGLEEWIEVSQEMLAPENKGV